MIRKYGRRTYSTETEDPVVWPDFEQNEPPKTLRVLPDSLVEDADEQSWTMTRGASTADGLIPQFSPPPSPDDVTPPRTLSET